LIVKSPYGPLSLLNCAVLDETTTCKMNTFES
jgi:hypothetical protein